MPPAGSDDRDARARRDERGAPTPRPVDPATSMFAPPSGGGQSGASEPPSNPSSGGDDPRDTRPKNAPPGIRAEPSAETEEPESGSERDSPAAAPPQRTGFPATPPPRVPSANPWGQDDYPPGYGAPASPSAPPQRYDRFGWPILDGSEAEGSETPTARPPQAPARPENNPPGSAPQGAPQPYNPYDTSSFQTPPMPNAPPRGPYSGQIPTQPPQQSGQWPVPPPVDDRQSRQFATPPGDARQSGPLPPMQEHPLRSGAFPIPPEVQRSGPFVAPPPAAERRSGQFPATPDAAYRSGAYVVPPEAAPSGYYPDAGGYPSGQFPTAPAAPSGAMPYAGEVTSTGSRRVIVAPDAGFGSLLTDRPALAFLLAAVVLAGIMIAYIALRYSHFPDQIALHFGPAGASQPNRIGEKRELWTIPFIVGIVLAANTALAWALFRYDRFAARLLTLGGALVAAIAWVVLLTLLHR